MARLALAERLAAVQDERAVVVGVIGVHDAAREQPDAGAEQHAERATEDAHDAADKAAGPGVVGRVDAGIEAVGGDDLAVLVLNHCHLQDGVGGVH